MNGPVITWVDESFDLMPVDHAIYVQHNHLTETLRREFHSGLHVSVHVLQPEITNIFQVPVTLDGITTI